MYGLCAWLALAAAAKPVDVDPSDLGALVDEAREVAETDPDLARDLLEWVIESRPPDDVRDEAKDLLKELPPGVSNWQATAKLAGWQAAAGAWTLGPAIALSTPGYIHPTVSIGGMALGGAGGMTAAFVYARNGRLTPARGTAIIGSQQLGAWNGAAIALIANSPRFDVGAGATVGLGVGALGGYGLATLDPDDGAIATAHSGALWGLGLGTTVMYMAFDPFESADSWRAQWALLAIATDLGAVGGYALGHGIGMRRADVRMANVGIVAGGALGLIATTLPFAWDLDPSVHAWMVTLPAVAGGVGTVVLGRELGISGKPLTAALIPVPDLAVGPGERRYGLRLVFEGGR